MEPWKYCLNLKGCLQSDTLYFTCSGAPSEKFWEKDLKRQQCKVWIKLSEAILSILGDYWGKFICSSLPARLMEEFSVSKVHLWAPATTCDMTYWEVFQFLSGAWEGPIGKMCVAQSEIKTFSGGGVKRCLANSTYQQLWTLHTKSPQTPWIVYFPATLFFQGHITYSKSPSHKNLPEEQIHCVPLDVKGKAGVIYQMRELTSISLQFVLYLSVL